MHTHGAQLVKVIQLAAKAMSATSFMTKTQNEYH